MSNASTRSASAVATTGPTTAAATVTVSAAAIAANLASYALVLAAAHLMSQADYGTLSSLLGLLLVAGVPMLALQTVTARRVAAGEGAAGLVRGTVLIGAWTTVAFAAISPLLSSFLHLRSPLGVLLVAATVAPTAVLGAAMGALQGARAFRRLAVLILLTTGGRSVGGLAGLAVHRTPVATMLGVLVGTLAAAAWTVLRSGRIAQYRRAARRPAGRGVVFEALNAGHAHASFLLLTSLDVLLARHVLPASAAGVYGVGSVITRSTLWLPQSVVTVLFASLAEHAAHRGTARKAVAAVAGVGAVLVAGSAALGPLVVTVFGGSRYHQLDGSVWLFALLGALLALVQLAVLAGLAQRHIGRALLLWTTASVDVIAVLSTAHPTPTRVVATLVIVTAVAAAAATVITLRAPIRQPDPATLPDTTSSPTRQGHSTR